MYKMYTYLCILCVQTLHNNVYIVCRVVGDHLAYHQYRVAGVVQQIGLELQRAQAGPAARSRRSLCCCRLRRCCSSRRCCCRRRHRGRRRGGASSESCDSESRAHDGPWALAHSVRQAAAFLPPRQCQHRSRPRLRWGPGPRGRTPQEPATGRDRRASGARS